MGMTGTQPELPEIVLNIICISLNFLHTSAWNPCITVHVLLYLHVGSCSSLVPRLSPSSLFICGDFYLREIYVQVSEGESLGGFDHMQTLIMRSVSTMNMSTYASPNEREKSD